MRATIAFAVLAIAVAIGWGFFAASQPAPARAQDLTTPVSAGWQAALPLDPALATRAYLDRVPDEMRARGEAVSQTRYWVLVSRIVMSIGAILLFLFSGAAHALATGLAGITRLLWLQSLMFAAALFVVIFAVTLPVEVYAGYVRWRSFGFADRPFLDWLQDDVLNWATLTAFYIVGMAAFGFLLRRFRSSWVGWAGVVYFILAAAYVVATPLYIEPLVNTYTPIPDSHIKRDILAMARANGVPADNVYTGDASRQSRLLNAHVSGIGGTARISIDDNTLAGKDESGVLWVVGHEMGHYVLGHIFNSVLVMTAVAILGFAFIAWLGPMLVRALGAQWGVSDFSQVASLAVFWLLFVVWGFLSDPILNAYTRWQEAQADIFGLNASQAPTGMAEFMIHDADIARLTPTELDVFLFYDHPSDSSRVEAAMRWRAAHAEIGSKTSAGLR